MQKSLIVLELVFALAAFIPLLFISAPYGRHVRRGWGPSIPARFAWMIMEFPAFLVIGLVVLLNIEKVGISGMLFLLFWEAHYVYRVFIYPFLLTSPKKPFPLVLVVMALCFNTVNGAANGLWIAGHGDKISSLSLLTDPRFWVGVALFFTGFIIHIRSDAILRALRRQNSQEYLIPQKGFFRLVSSPNYLGEMIEWAGYAVATWSPAALAFVVFTVANLLPRAISNHRWYCRTFSGYPKNRKILLPFIW